MIPGSFGDATFVTTVQRAENNRSTTILAAIGYWQAPRNLPLYRNAVMGTMPETTGNQTALTTLQMLCKLLLGTLLEVLGKHAAVIMFSATP